jgi:hypothetical protein
LRYTDTPMPLPAAAATLPIHCWLIIAISLMMLSPALFRLFHIAILHAEAIDADETFADADTPHCHSP